MVKTEQAVNYHTINPLLSKEFYER